MIGDLLVRFREDLTAHADSEMLEADPVLIAPIVDLVDGRFTLDETFLDKQPDWSHDETDSGELPVDRLSTTPVSAPAPADVRHGTRRSRVQRRSAIRSPSLLALHDTIRDDLDAALGASDGDEAVANLEEHLEQQVEVADRLIFPMVQRVTATGDDAVWSAELHALDALTVTEALAAGAGHERGRLDRLALDVRRTLDDSERIVYPLLRQHLDETEQTDLADAVDEILAARERALGSPEGGM